MKDSCLIIGAGAIGKSVAGYSFSRAGYFPVFADVSAEVINDLNNRREYRIYKSKEQYDTVGNVSCIDAKDIPAVINIASKVGYICCSTGESGLKSVLYTLGEAIKVRKSNLPLYILFCENIKGIKEISTLYFQSINADMSCVRLIETSIERMTKPFFHHTGRYDVMAESYIPIILSKDDVEKSNLFDNYPDLFMPVDNIDAYYSRKIHTNNLGHSVIGYMGYLKKYDCVSQAVCDDEIRVLLDKALIEAGEMLKKKYGFSDAQMQSHIEVLVNERYSNNNLSDPVTRVARDPIRKLSRDERLTGTALSCLEYDIFPEAVIKTISFALKYNNPDDKQAMQLNSLYRRGCIDDILTNICGLNRAEELFKELQKEFL